MTPTNPPESTSDSDAYDTIAPADVRLTATATEEDSAGAGARPGNALPVRAIAAFAALCAVALLVILVLPDTVTERDPEAARTLESDAVPEASATAAAQPAQPAPQNQEPIVPPFEEIRLERERRAAQETLAGMLTLIEDLEARAVERWGADELATARAIAERGDAEFLEQAYPQAQASYREAVEALEQLGAQAQRIVAERIATGTVALEAGDAATAGTDFELALAMDPGNVDAARGVQRAAVLDEVLDLIEDAEDIAADGALTAARGLVTQALELDSDNPQARAAAARLDEELRAAAFARAMSAGYTALRERRFEQADAEFERARKLRPAAPEVAEATRTVAAERLAARIDALRIEAEQLDATQRWSDAAERYRAALELDATLAFAQRGLRQAEARAGLDTSLEDALAHPERLNEASVLSATRTLLRRAQSITDPDPRLADQSARLEQTLRLAVIPVPVAFRSDETTDVRLLRVEAFGQFSSRTLDLLPGAYVATGTRRGYRDVRIEFIVTPQGVAAPIDIRCSARI